MKTPVLDSMRANHLKVFADIGRKMLPEKFSDLIAVGNYVVCSAADKDARVLLLAVSNEMKNKTGLVVQVGDNDNRTVDYHMIVSASEDAPEWARRGAICVVMGASVDVVDPGDKFAGHLLTVRASQISLVEDYVKS